MENIKAKAKFVKIAESGKWGVLVTGGAPKTGDEFSIRKASGDTTIVMVDRVVATHAGGAVCSIIERRTIAEPRTPHPGTLTAGQRQFIAANGGYSTANDACGFDDDYRGRR